MTTPTPPRATRREWIGLAVLALPCMLATMDLTVLNLALPAISADLAPSSAQLLWIVDIYGFLIAGSLITMGTLGDRIGRRRLLLIGAAAFGAASILAALSSSAEMLIATRALLGVAGATLAPSTLSLIRNMFLDPRERTLAIGIWTMSFSVGGAIGPLLGGVMLEHFWWGSAFLLGVPVMVLLLALGPSLLPEFRDPNAGRLDVRSAVLSLGAVLPVIYGLKRLAEDGWGATPVVSVMLGFAVGVVFVRRQRTLADPLIDLALFRVRAFSASLAANSIAIFVTFAAFLFIHQYLQLVLGMSPLEAGLWTLPASAGFIVGSITTPLLARHVRPDLAIAGGFSAAAVGFAMLTQAHGASGFLILLVGMTVFSLGVSPVVTLGTDLVIGTAPPERAGAAAAISETAIEFGGALGIAVLGSIGTTVYRRAMAHGIPAIMPADSFEIARSTLGGAVAVAERLPLAAGAELLGTARSAFVQAMDLTSWICAVVALGMAVFAAMTLRRDRPATITE